MIDGSSHDNFVSYSFANDALLSSVRAVILLCAAAAAVTQKAVNSFILTEMQYVNVKFMFKLQSPYSRQ